MDGTIPALTAYFRPFRNVRVALAVPNNLSTTRKVIRSTTRTTSSSFVVYGLGRSSHTPAFPFEASKASPG